MTRIIDLLMSRGAFATIAIIAAASLVYEILLLLLVYHVAAGCLNWLNVSAIVAVVAGLYLARQIDDRLTRGLRELWLQGTLQYPTDPTDALQQRILKKHRRLEVLSALLFMGMMALVYAPFYALIADMLLDISGSQTQVAILYIVQIAIGIAAGLIVGAFFGRLATYGSMASVLADLTELNVRPTHFDGANGLRPVGNFYLYQAVLTAVPLVWLAGWAFFYPAYAKHQLAACGVPEMPWFPLQTYAQWALVATFAYFGFVRPVFALKRRLLAARDELLRTRLPAIDAHIQHVREQMQEPLSDGAKALLADRLHDLAREHWAVRNMSVWPMDIATLQKYAPIEIGTKLLPIAIGPMLPKEGSEDGAITSPFGWAGRMLRAFLDFVF